MIILMIMIDDPAQPRKIRCNKMAVTVTRYATCPHLILIPSCPHVMSSCSSFCLHRSENPENPEHPSEENLMLYLTSIMIHETAEHSRQHASGLPAGDDPVDVANVTLQLPREESPNARCYLEPHSW